MKYNIIYADPPWQYSFPGTRSIKQDDYKTMSIKDIIKIPVNTIAENNSVLLVWGIWNRLYDALVTIGAWGFNYKTVAFVWVKTNKRINPMQYSFLPQDSFDEFFGMGSYTRANTEFCLLGTKGKITPISKKVRQIIYYPIRKHSQKPKEAKKRIVQLFGDLPRIELFAREKTIGWHVWGNEVDSDIDL